MRIDLVTEAIRDVIALVNDRGTITKDEVLSAWPLSSEEYALLRERVLREPGVTSGGKGRGGFEMPTSRSRLPGDEESDDIVTSASWERETVDRLCSLFQHADLERLLGGLVYTIRQARKHRTGDDRRGTKRELAAALVIQHGQDLFRDTAIRRAVGKACRLSCPGRWHPGKQAAVGFVQGASFPLELAGLRVVESRPDFELLEGRVELKPLQPFQKEIQRKLLNVLYQPADRGLVTLPTGAGKTRVAVESLRYWLADRYDRRNGAAENGLAIWLAHTEELCEQAYACFKQVWEAETQHSPLLLVRFWGRYTSKEDAVAEVAHQSRLVPTILISTPQRLINLIRGTFTAGAQIMADLDTVAGLVVIDEAHRAAARSYSEIVEHFTRLTHPVAVVGLTATPYRMEYMPENADQGTIELREIFRQLIEPCETLGSDPRLRLQEMKILARPDFETLETTTSLRLPQFEDDGADEETTVERLDQAMKLKTDNTPRRLLVHERLLELSAIPGASILYFGPSVSDAECMAYLLRSSGVPCAVITGNTRDAVRREVIHDFKQGRITVLCNCEVLTTGFDAPRVTHVMMARPTVSQVLYEQMVGRGLRGPRFGGTERCTIIDCKDTIRGAKPELGYEAFRRVWGV
jgi:superfamily II DNA or RNA helicase